MSSLALLLALSFSLEWNGSCRTGVPYEIEIDSTKIQEAPKLCVWADGQPLATSHIPGELPSLLRLRFSPPPGTRRLECRDSGVTDGTEPENLFAQALSDGGLPHWRLEKGVSIRRDGDGVRFVADDSAPVETYVEFSVPVPHGFAGRPVRQDIDLVAHSPIVRRSIAMVAQRDADGNHLPETLCDLSETCLCLPPERPVRYRTSGRIHPDATELVFRLMLVKSDASFGAYGHPLADSSARIPDVSLCRLCVRVAEELPFPKWNDSFFGPGVSGADADASIALGGEKAHGFFFQTHSRGCWSGAKPAKKESEMFFPVGAGTVEAWVRPNWRDFAKTCRGGVATGAAVVFAAYGNYDYVKPAAVADIDIPTDDVMRVAYRPGDGAWEVSMTDWRGHRFARTFTGLPRLEDGKWEHVALTWTPGDRAMLFVGGKKAAELPLEGFEPIPLGDAKYAKCLDDLWAVELYFGCSRKATRTDKNYGDVDPAHPFFEGLGDSLRVSSGLRYTAAFEPERRFEIDSATRAIFAFDRSFDGESGGGFLFVPGTVWAKEDRIDHTIKGDCGDIAYYPQTIAPELDPWLTTRRSRMDAKILPTEADFKALRVRKAAKRTMRNGDVFEIECPDGACPDFTEYANSSQTPVRYPILVRNGLVDPRSFGDIADSLALDGLAERQRVERVFNWLSTLFDYFYCPTARFKPDSDEPIYATGTIMPMLNAYCGFDCGSLNWLGVSLFTTVSGCPSMLMPVYHHSINQVRFGGKSHLYDLSHQTFAVAMDNETTAGLDDGHAQASVWSRAGLLPERYVRRGLRDTLVVTRDIAYDEKFAPVLNPGESVRFSFCNRGGLNNIAQCQRGGRAEANLGKDGRADYTRETGASPSGKLMAIRQDRVFPFASMLELRFDGRPGLSNPAFTNLADGAFAYRVKSVYPALRGEYSARLADGRFAEIGISTDGCGTFTPVAVGFDGCARPDYRIRAREAFWVKVCAPIGKVESFHALTEAQVNPRTYPGWAAPGRSRFEFKCDGGGIADVTVGWLEDAGAIEVSPLPAWGAVRGCEQGLVLVDPSHPTRLSVSGVSSKAVVRTGGGIAASLESGALTVECVAGESRCPFFSILEIEDRGARKPMTVLVSRDARLVVAADAAMEGQKAFSFEPLPSGTYDVLALVRFGNEPSGGAGPQVFLRLPEGEELVARHWNRCMNFAKLRHGAEGGRAEWKWDCATVEKAGSGFRLLPFRLAEGTDSLEFAVRRDEGDLPVEMAALLVVPRGSDDFLLELRNRLFGLNPQREIAAQAVP